MNELNGFKITKRDRVLRAWQVSTGLVREYQEYAREIEPEDKELAKMFAQFSENEAHTSAMLLKILQNIENIENA